MKRNMSENTSDIAAAPFAAAERKYRWSARGHEPETIRN
jgi:hypothetical protein